MIRPLVLLILDGWGLAPPGPGNAISLSKLTNIPKYWVSYPHTKLAASGLSVGLPHGEAGNTETGHINIGAGRVVYQDLPRINMSISDRSFFNNDAFLQSLEYSKQHNSNVHIMGVISSAGVHASREHLYALLEFFKIKDSKSNILLHLFTDGRDSSPQSGLRFIDEVETMINQYSKAKIATIIGRYYAMDRDKRWQRTQFAYQALTEIIDRQADSAHQAIQQSYDRTETDEFIKPTIIKDGNGQPLPRIKEHDIVIFYNYRIDRPRQLTRAFVQSDFETKKYVTSFDPYAVKYYHKHILDDDENRGPPFKRNVVLKNLFFVTMTEYERNLPCTVAYPPQSINMPLGRVYSEIGLRQLRVAETEKERFVGYYFNGVREDLFPGEDRLIVPSPKVPTYDLMPQMSAHELTEKLIDRLSLGVYSLFVVNFANPDMVGHTGNIQAAIKACEVTDECVGKIVRHTLSHEGTCIITADHGNVEEMVGAEGEMDTEHSRFPVPMIIVDKTLENYPIVLPAGRLCDIAPTILALNNIKIPSEMTGKNSLVDVNIKRR